MDAHSVRIHSLDNLEAMAEVLRGLHSESPPQIQRIVDIIGALVASAKPPFNPNALRGPLSHLLNAIGEYEAEAVFTPQKFEILCMARAFAAVALTRVNMREPPLGAAAVPAIVVANGERLQPPGAAAVPAIVVANDAGRGVQQSPAPSSSSSRVSRRLTKRRTLKKEKQQDAAYPLATAATSPAQKRRKTLPANFVNKKGNDDDGDDVAAVIEKKQCDDCGLLVVDDEMDWLRHAWDKHKDQVHKFRLRPDMVCSTADCDYIGGTVKSLKRHEWAVHNYPARKIHPLPELQTGNCTYCNVKVASLVALKRHLMNDCKKRDERPMLGCTGCNKSFHFIYDFCAHLKVNNNMHGNPVMLRHE